MRIRLPDWLVNLIVGAIAYWRGRTDEQKRQKQKADALEEHYEKIADSDLGADDAFTELRDRARSADRLPKP